MNLYTLCIQSVLRCIVFVYSFRCDSRIFRAQSLLRSFLHNPFFYSFLITATIRLVTKPSYIDVSYIDSFGCIGSSDVYQSFNLTDSFSRCYFSLGTMAAPKKQICKGCFVPTAIPITCTPSGAVSHPGLFCLARHSHS